MSTREERKKAFRRVLYRGIDAEDLARMPVDEVLPLLSSRCRRKFGRGLKRQHVTLLRKLRDAKLAAPAGEKPVPVKTHLRSMIILPEMIGSAIGVYNGQSFMLVEVRPQMVGQYLGEFSLTYKPVNHGRAGVGATKSSKFVPLK
ncbi:hypothetical protein J8273_5694 [Carpediemonas membranifera]|uniref:40S ribosomal protein S15 n=1 Tax=Carpediemonas membranifera TaxID=201153 RepID=A0A8J6B4S9_9EUKA|nr:hypothetical protein J8273_5694 [Carpediemonas membranifera]|eukprot:KAG9392882.1 hypothetical protein J8273_5694 [Carpediemonas membranifera]